MTDTEAPRTSADNPGWPPWRGGMIAANAVTVLALVIAHTIHATDPFSDAVALPVLGLTRVFLAISSAVWAISEVNRWNSRRSTAALRAEIRAVHGAVDQLRRQLSADLAAPLGQLADAVEHTGTRVDALAGQVAEHGDARYLEGTQQALNAVSPGGDVLPMPRRHAGVNNAGPVV